jgi:tetratricopeptide (TPR) repeat protein
VILVGERLGNYLVKRRLGGGGFGEVFLADDEAIPDRQVAIKLLRQRAADHGDLLWEMQMLARLKHPNVVGFYHHFTDQNRLCLVMEFCPGGSLHDRLAQGACSESQAFTWGLQLCDTLEFVHKNGIVHHDIKPHNVLFAGDDTIKIGDFGVANRNVGTRLYMPPEMLLGERVSRTDSRVDEYALGLTLIESIGGRHPFEDLTPDEANQARIRHEVIPDGLTRWAQEVLLRATHPTPELRFQSVGDFGAAIRSRHVPFVFDGSRIKADTLAKRAEAAMSRRKWKSAEHLASHALELSPKCVAALLTAGRIQLATRRVERARDFFSKAVSISPRTPVQKELGWINLEQGNVPLAISVLTDHLERHGSDYEAYNLLLKCFYLTDRFEAADALAQALIDQHAPSGCFRNNQLLCHQLSGVLVPEAMDKVATDRPDDPILAYNLAVIRERPRAWAEDGPPLLKSKLIFQEYGLGIPRRPGRVNTVVFHSADGRIHRTSSRVVSIGSASTNELVITDGSISRRHAVVLNFPNEVWIHDLDSTRGTTVNGSRICGRVLIDGVYDVNFGRVAFRIAPDESLLL